MDNSIHEKISWKNLLLFANSASVDKHEPQPSSLFCYLVVTFCRWDCGHRKTLKTHYGEAFWWAFWSVVLYCTSLLEYHNPNITVMNRVLNLMKDNMVSFPEGYKGARNDKWQWTHFLTKLILQLIDKEERKPLKQISAIVT